MAPLRALVLLVDGIEEMEAIGPADFLRRAEVEVITAGLHGLDPINCTQKTRILPDAAFDDVAKERWDLIVVPGGLEGSKNFAKEQKVGEILRAQLASDGHVGAICAAPMVLATHGIQKGATMTSYPLTKEMMKEHGYTWSDQRVVVDGKLITSQGPGTTFEFPIKLVEILKGSEEAKKLSDYLLL
ncbi:hypothetical protein PRIPAC_80818 [Pristionchus pacificus]|uniref:D-lactate dehydratase n=1 Tax=Pristionchus pacificus TaxID=54126 RepID=A0A2A6CNE6_PRIPA|nr:hypothetical protein PRIPAC_80818 [Pristionchus pacificus]|eukprot:PDM79649.1 djr-1.1 [Pristionchus pacificus]